MLTGYGPYSVIFELVLVVWFFYLGFLIPILKVQFEFPYVIYQAVTMYLLLAIGWHGGEAVSYTHLTLPTILRV